jgi:hypothetical protein
MIGSLGLPAYIELPNDRWMVFDREHVQGLPHRSNQPVSRSHDPGRSHRARSRRVRKEVVGSHRDGNQARRQPAHCGDGHHWPAVTVVTVGEEDDVPPLSITCEHLVTQCQFVKPYCPLVCTAAAMSAMPLGRPCQNKGHGLRLDKPRTFVR